MGSKTPVGWIQPFITQKYTDQIDRSCSITRILFPKMEKYLQDKQNPAVHLSQPTIEN